MAIHSDFRAVESLRTIHQKCCTTYSSPGNCHQAIFTRIYCRLPAHDFTRKAAPRSHTSQTMLQSPIWARDNTGPNSPETVSIDHRRYQTNQTHQHPPHIITHYIVSRPVLHGNKTAPHIHLTCMTCNATRANKIK